MSKILTHLQVFSQIFIVFSLERTITAPKVLKALLRIFLIKLHFEKTQEYLTHPELLDKDFHLLIMLNIENPERRHK